MPINQMTMKALDKAEYKFYNQPNSPNHILTGSSDFQFYGWTSLVILSRTQVTIFNVSGVYLDVTSDLSVPTQHMVCIREIEREFNGSAKNNNQVMTKTFKCDNWVSLSLFVQENLSYIEII